MTGQAIIWVGGAYALAALVAYAGYRAKSLSASGAIAACLVGGTIFGIGGLDWAVLLLAFFASSSLLSFFKAADTRKIEATETFDKGGRRDAAQVLANGGVAAALAAFSGLAGGGPPYFYLFAGYVGALAAATSDTWATELGVLSRTRPRMITTGKSVDAGTSGAVTIIGIAAAVGGAIFIGLVAATLLLFYGNEVSLIEGAAALVTVALAGGIGGSVLDSLLGATVQSSYLCPHCEKATESRIHRCGTPARLTGGVAAINNDVVNFMATLSGALIAVLAYSVLGNPF